MLLSRNISVGIPVVPNQPEPEKFNIIPDWLQENPTPWNLVAFFQEVLSRSNKDGKPKDLCNDYGAELRPAKILLDTYGLKRTTELILEKTQALTNIESFTLWRVIDYGKQVEKQVAERGHAKRLQPIPSDQTSR